MKKAMIYLEEDQFYAATDLAQKRKSSFAEVCRMALEEYLRINGVKTKPILKSDPLLKLIGIASSSPKSGKKNNDAEEHDEILYRW
jgi:hypothetical protein